MTHIDTEEKANAVINSVNRLWGEGKTIDDFVSLGRQEGQINSLTNNILKMNIKGFSAQEISNILEVEIDFVNNVIAKK